MTVPKPDRSDITPNLVTTDENSVLDIGWNEGFLSDARPYRIEFWADEQVRSLTFFLSTTGIENWSNAQFADLLEREQLVAYKEDRRRSAYAMPCTDASGNSLWSVNVVTGDGEGDIVDVLAKIRPYAPPLPSVSLHTATTAAAAWHQFAGALATCLGDLQDDEFLIVSRKTSNHYVQFAGQGTFGLRIEATSNTFLEPDAVLTDTQYATMAELGWQRATELPREEGVPSDPDGSPNFFVDVVRPVNHARVSHLAVTTLQRVYGVVHPGQLQYHSFSVGGDTIRFPTLGISRQLV